MCGIVGYVGTRDALPLLLSGLQRLEYRGYDSTGLAVCSADTMRVVRSEGKLQQLQSKINPTDFVGHTGVGHTRWATHGKPSDQNAHPHCSEHIAIVHNGIIENYHTLRNEIESDGYQCVSETDSEIIAHLILKTLRDGAQTLSLALRGVLPKLEGSYAIVLLSEREPERIVAATNGSPLVIGKGKNEMFLASDVTAFLSETNHVVYLEAGDVVTLEQDSIDVVNHDGMPVSKSSSEITWNITQAEKQGFRHFMLKEIYEQPQVLSDTLSGRIDAANAHVVLDEISIDPALQKLSLIACGTSFHAALIGRFLFEQLARISSSCELASEFRYRNPVIGTDELTVVISQSGETADTMIAAQEAKRLGSKILAISNVIDSSLPRFSDHVLYTRAGPEISVASTKAFTTQLVTLALLAIHIGVQKNTIDDTTRSHLIDELMMLPTKMADSIRSSECLQDIIVHYENARGFIFLGRGNLYPIALEGALKLKETSYLHAEGYPAGEMKHGPIAMIDKDFPVIALAPQGVLYPKMKTNIAEVKSRGARVIAIATEGDKEITSLVDDVVFLPDIHPLFLPVLASVPMQLFAYYVADRKGTDIDQPRNLAKSVTVE